MPALGELIATTSVEESGGATETHDGERDQSRVDGGSELDALREEEEAGAELTRDQEAFLVDEERDSWLRPDLPLRDTTGRELAPGEKVPPRPSSYGMTIDSFAVGQ